MFPDEIETWLGPIFVAMFKAEEGGTAFSQILQSAVNDSRGPGGQGIDWIKVGQEFRAALGWDHYPESPPIP